MKEKFLVSILAVVMILTSVGVCFAESSSIQIRYVSVSAIKTNLSISGGRAIANAIIEPMSKNNLDSVAVTVKVINSSTKETVKTWNETLSMDSTNAFYYENSVKLISKGNYYTKVVAKCYKDGKLIETISTESKVVSY